MISATVSVFPVPSVNTSECINIAKTVVVPKIIIEEMVGHIIGIQTLNNILNVLQPSNSADSIISVGIRESAPKSKTQLYPMPAHIE